MSAEMANANPVVGNKRRRLSIDGHCIGGCGNPSCSEKRKTEEDSDHNVSWWYFKLDSESEPFDSDEPDSLKNESVWSVQQRDTDSVHDSNDSESRWRQTHANEYEVASLHSGNELNPFSCSSADESCSSVEGLVVATVAPDGITIDYFADSSSDSGSTDESSDPELQPQDKWSCLKCKQKNQPIPRYCQHCFSVRKQWFPPRPKAHKKRQEANHEPLPIPPQIQTTPNLTIPDLSDLKGNPFEDSIQRSFSESVSRYASMTQEQKLDQLKEQIQRNKLVQAHSDKHLANFLNETTPDEIINAGVSSKGSETIRPELPENESGGKKSCHSNSGAVAKARSSSSNSSAKTVRVESKIVQAHDGVRPVGIEQEMDFRAKVAQYLASCVSPVLDTPPQSQDSEFALDGPSETPQPPHCDNLISEDVVDGVVKRQADTIKAANSNSFSTVGAGDKMCSFCAERKADTAFIHARKGHLCACYACAKQVYAVKGQCPICQRQASSVCKIYF